VAPAASTGDAARDAEESAARVTGGKGGVPSRLAVAINAARQLAQHARGVTLPADVADRIAEHLRAAQRLLAGKPAAPPAPVWSKTPPRVQTGTRRYRLWRRSPLCLWCGRLTRIEAVHEDDAATLDHLYRRGERGSAGHLPPSLLACRRCNSDRGEPKARSPPGCPVVEGKGAD
jgi:hypothetical protein